MKGHSLPARAIFVLLLIQIAFASASCAEGPCNAQELRSYCDTVGGCPAGQQLCGQACKLLAIDPLNCGGCGITCSQSQFCRNGVCTTPSSDSGNDGCSEQLGTCSSASAVANQFAATIVDQISSLQTALSQCVQQQTCDPSVLSQIGELTALNAQLSQQVGTLTQQQSTVQLQVNAVSTTLGELTTSNTDLQSTVQALQQDAVSCAAALAAAQSAGSCDPAQQAALQAVQARVALLQQQKTDLTNNVASLDDQVWAIHLDMEARAPEFTESVQVPWDQQAPACTDSIQDGDMAGMAMVVRDCQSANIALWTRAIVDLGAVIAESRMYASETADLDQQWNTLNNAVQEATTLLDQCLAS